VGKWGSLAGLIAMAAGLGVLYAAGHLFGRHPLSIGVQVLAPVLMIAARVTFGLRSFHGMANPTAGGLVTTGPYRYIRHPIYASIIYFAWAGALDRPTWVTVASALLVTAGGLHRMLAEERLVVARYPEYRDYQARVARVIPYLL
jgi:protein-S-isoprenylcysteine O-methyltransferase Ste14